VSAPVLAAPEKLYGIKIAMVEKILHSVVGAEA
jgi:hypothetical protein